MLIQFRQPLSEAVVALAAARSRHLWQSLQTWFSKLKKGVDLLVDAFDEALEMRRSAHRSYHPIIEE